MYSDRIASSAAGSRKRSIKDRLGTVQNGDESFRERHNKRFQSYDEKWQHDMYDGARNNQLAIKDEQFGSQDLRSRLKKTVSRNPPGETIMSGGIRDLREKLSGPTVPPQPHPQVVSLPNKHSSAVKAVTPTMTATPVSKPSTAATKPPAGPKLLTGGEAMTIANFLQSLGLSKYLITFQAEEIDMSVLRVMKDDELKELGIPMGPRKKINLALASQSKTK